MLSTGSNERQAHSHSRLPYLPALDGLRAVAVIGVLLYHADLPLFKGGFLGVDVFFVISGYLITSLLLGEWNQTGKLDLRAFWARRARRLLPALFLLLGMVLILSVFFLHDEVAGLRSDAIAAFGYITNWYLIFNEQSYFEAAGRPSLFQHLWSLAVEEQFYILWPILFALLMKFARRFILPIVIVGIITSALLMGALYAPEVDPSRVYYGTDTRAAGLLVGVALALILGNKSSGHRPSQLLSWIREVACGVAFATVLIMFMIVTESEPYLYRGGFLVLEIAVALLIASIVLPGARHIPRLLGSRVPRWIGLRSYGIYLWHWPVFMLTRARVDVELDGVPLLFARLALTLVLAEMSFRFIETPIRRGSLQRIWNELRVPTDRRVNVSNLRLSATLVTLLLLAVTVGPPIVSAKPPEMPPYLVEESVNTIAGIDGNRGQPLDTPTPRFGKYQYASATVTVLPTTAALATSTATSTPTFSVAESATTTATSTALATIAVEKVPRRIALDGTQHIETATNTAIVEEPTSTPLTLEMATEEASPTPSPTETATTLPTATNRPRYLTDDDALYTPTIVPESAAGPGAAEPQSLVKIVAIGDSVMLGAVKELTRVIPDIAVDAKVSRQEADVISLLASYRESGLLGDVVLIHIGNNGLITTRQFDQIMSILADRKWVVFVNLSVPRKWEEPNNALLSEEVARYPNAAVVDWYSASLGHREYFAADGFHLQPKGQKAYAALIADKLSSLVSP